MYKRNAQGWSKHLDFIILDEIMLMVSFLLATVIRHGRVNLDVDIYRNLMFVLALADLLVIIFFNIMHDVLKRGYAKELSATFKLVLVVFLVATGFMFTTQSGESYSRLVLYYSAGLHFVLGYSTRVLAKLFLQHHGRIVGLGHEKRTMLAVLKAENAEAMINRLQANPAKAYKLAGIVLASPSDTTEICGVPVVCSLESASDYICREWIDSVYIDCPSDDKRIQALMSDCREMSVPVHYHIPGVSKHKQKQFVERIGGSTVLTLSNNYATPLQLLTKRLLDIAGGIFGSIIALLIIAIVGPMIKRVSPGPILYRSERIGQNGKHFHVFKFSSMRNDLVFA